ncbi:MAG: hypothetical protein ACKVQC_09715 [Elusimicrobiota bacterium]
MNKRIVVLSLFAATLGVWTPVHAFQSVSRATVAASVLVGGSNTSNVSVNIRDISNWTTPRGTVTWSGVTPPSTGWKRADQGLLLNATVLGVGSGVQIYSDNTASDATTRFVDPTPGDKTNPDSMAAGLVKGASGVTSASPLPMAWTIKASSITAPTSAEPNNAGDPNSFQWLYFKDRYNDQNIPALNSLAFVDGEAFITMIRTNTAAGGAEIHFGQAPADFGAHPNGANSFVYLQGNFITAQVQETYRSNLRVEAYIQ